MEEMVQSAETAEVLNNAEQEQVKSERGKEIDGERYIPASSANAQIKRMREEHAKALAEFTKKPAQKDFSEKLEENEFQTQIKAMQEELEKIKREKQVSEYVAELTKRGLPAEVAVFLPSDGEQAAEVISILDKFKTDKDNELVAAQKRMPVPKATLQPTKQSTSTLSTLFEEHKKRVK